MDLKIQQTLRCIGNAFTSFPFNRFDMCEVHPIMLIFDGTVIRNIAGSYHMEPISKVPLKEWKLLCKELQMITLGKEYITVEYKFSLNPFLWLEGNGKKLKVVYIQND